MSLSKWSCAVAICLAACSGGRGFPPQGPLGVPDATHAAPTDGDIDGDGRANEADNCPSIANASQNMAACAYVRPAPAPTNDAANDALARINYYRALVGLSRVELDEDATAGCAAHVEYMRRLSRELAAPQLVDEEDSAHDYASPEGSAVAGTALLTIGTPDIASAIDSWMSTLYQRLPFLHPGLHHIGAAFAQDDVQTAWMWTCIELRSGTDTTITAPHPIEWPPPDMTISDRHVTSGSLEPCPTHDDPLDGQACLPGPVIATLGLNGLGALSGFDGTITNLATGDSVPIFRTWYDGGQSPHERMGYLPGTVAMVPSGDFTYAPGSYEVAASGSVGGMAQTYRWRFQIDSVVNEQLACDLLGPQGTFDQAVRVTVASIDGRICDAPDFYHFVTPGSYNVTLSYDSLRGDLDLIQYDEARLQVAAITGATSPATLTAIPGGYLEVRGANGDIGPYTLLLENAP